MKRFISILLCSLMVIMLASCENTVSTGKENVTVSTAGTQIADTATNTSSEGSENGQKSQPDEPSGSKVLVVYFSRTGEQYNVGVINKGNTAIVADMIIEATGADSFEILPQEDYYPYTYAELTNVAKQEQNDNTRPVYQGEVPDLAQYDTIFIGAPVWWGDWPMICYTFFENNADALAGKTLIPFSTHEGSGLSGFDIKLAAVLPNSSVGEGLAIRGQDAQNDQDSVRNSVNKWITGLGI